MKAVAQGVGGARGPSRAERRRRPVTAAWPALVIVLVVGAAYAGSFSGAWVYDDREAVVGNASLRSGSLFSALRPPADGSPVTGRPVLNLTFALDRRLAGESVWIYHATNLAIHLAAALTLFGLLRRTRIATTTALAIATLWAVHPLQTESVTYISQRAESLMALFYLLTLYCFIRGTGVAEASDSGGLPAVALPARRSLGEAGAKAARPWTLLSIACCALGMATKEVMVTAPVVVLLYDYTFVAGSLAEAWRRRSGYYLSLAGSWLLLVYLVLGAGGRHATAGFATSVPWWGYLQAQVHAIVHYLALAIWPHPLVFNYDRSWHLGTQVILLDGLILAALLGATVIGLVKRTAWGFAGACFFAVLAPSSSIVPISTEIMAEHRCYLALAAVIAVLVTAAARVGTPRRGVRRWGGFALCCVVFAFAILTSRRNDAYRSAVSLWTDTVAKVPDNPYAWNNLAVALAEAGKPADALPEYARCLQLKPDYAEAHLNRGLAYAALARYEEAASDFTAALRLDRNYAKAKFNLAEAQIRIGNQWAAEGRISGAIAAFRAAVAAEPESPEAHNNLGAALIRAGRLQEAAGEFEAVLRLRPDDAAARHNLAIVQARAELEIP